MKASAIFTIEEFELKTLVPHRSIDTGLPVSVATMLKH